MEEFKNNPDKRTGETPESSARESAPSYPSSIEKMSDKWRQIKREGEGEVQGNFFDRHFLAIGIGVALLIVILIVVFGGVAFLIWNAR